MAGMLTEVRCATHRFCLGGRRQDDAQDKRSDGVCVVIGCASWGGAGFTRGGGWEDAGTGLKWDAGVAGVEREGGLLGHEDPDEEADDCDEEHDAEDGEGDGEGEEVLDEADDEPHVERHDAARRQPAQHLHPERVCEGPHEALAAGEAEERQNRERQLQGQDRLRGEKELVDAVVAEYDDDDDRGGHGHEAREEAP
eukprot:CAMPEP_0196661446 /NCGR_PEP_ID=MMETSP1086-20130531/44333_1 /TAXON_ID=77921 /ORGANISM="Cyanoptyche  gloeocystis , Strain SAG4.97" /LENGTH=196 /DNA_ID=CAMNT_0041996345 /DNA_START=437 /DNA_END=1024 /DNA_ORIENTATION=+